MTIFVIGMLAVLFIWATWLVLALIWARRVVRLAWWLLLLGLGVFEERLEQRLFDQEEKIIRETLQRAAAGTLDLE